MEEAAALAVLRQSLAEQRAGNAAREERLAAAEGSLAQLKARAETPSINPSSSH